MWWPLLMVGDFFSMTFVGRWWIASLLMTLCLCLCLMADDLYLYFIVNALAVVGGWRLMSRHLANLPAVRILMHLEKLTVRMEQRNSWAKFLVLFIVFCLCKKLVDLNESMLTRRRIGAVPNLFCPEACLWVGRPSISCILSYYMCAT